MSVWKKIKGLLGLVDGTPDYLIGVKANGEIFRTKLNDKYKVGWSFNSYELDNTSPNSESTPLHLQTNFITTQDYHLRVDYSYDDTIGRALGTLHSIGDTVSVTDWAFNDNRRVIVTAKHGCWYNIKNNGTIVTNKTKPIVTMTNGDVEQVIKAVFTYDATRNIWLLESYELLSDWQSKWFRRYDFEILPSSSSSLSISASGMKFKGFYEFDVFCEVAEKDMSNQFVNTTSVQSLLVRPNGGSSLLVCLSPFFTFTIGAPINVNRSLQGSGIIHLDQDLCSNRSIDIIINLPNGAQKSVSNGYLHLRYLGNLEGQNC